MRTNYSRAAPILRIIRIAPAIMIALLGMTLASCQFSDPRTPHVLIRTSAGDIEVELYPGQAPRTAGAFLGYVDSGFYANSSFYRVLNDDNQPMGAPKSELV